ncbi:thymidine kinase (plasmid) [Rhodoferax ferrireducens T118]|uniref:Thymidine kinase n=1 Tax=Albidiferax ferrireducens (strain ATCC BAA-621 / DSM 15236 / T118) TaxID=338969 RepID=KITH_ALBFT|nr:thymidine kinase [Rhodoferax ferrireducens]Q21Q74.1 RecName: Full=Thymidine kinase [Rhodoferax ferrireducens T118]ABD72071.1 thymidine kinase [Rhodoferax ferrireducens T118]
MSQLTFIFAAMNAGKSTLLLQAAHNYVERGMAVELYTAALDTRAGLGVIRSRLGIERGASTFNADTVFDHRILERDTACLLIDESQFLRPVQVRQLHRLAHTSQVPIRCYGLRSDFLGHPFAGSAALLTLADEFEEVRAVCGCGKKATMNARLDATGARVSAGEQTLIGGNERYIAMCPRCFYLDSAGEQDAQSTAA